MDPLLAILVPGRERPAVLGPVDAAGLPPGAVTVAVRWSGMNYKDALAITGAAPVVRAFPMVPGIDLGGVVMASEDPAWRPGDAVIATGDGMGETRWGGYATRMRVAGGMLLPPPAGWDVRRTMIAGTAGLTAALCVAAIERAGLPAGGLVAVTGAAGGVGSVAVAMLARLGYRVSAISGRAAEAAWLRGLGAAEVLPRSVLEEKAEKSLLAERWDAAIDVAGGKALAGLLRSIRWGGAVAACGMAAGGELPATVYPFILRNVSLAGVACSTTPLAARGAAWARLAAVVPGELIDALAQEIALDEVIATAPRLLAGTVRGRVVVKVG